MFRNTFAAIVLVLLSHASRLNLEAAEFQEQTIERTANETLTYRCLVSLPEEYADDADQRWPLILFLHGGGTPSDAQLKKSIRGLTDLPAIVVAPLCPPSEKGARYTNWDWKMLGEAVREIGQTYRVDEKKRSVIGFSMGGSGAWELPSFEPKLFSKSVVIAGVCHPWSLRNYSKTTQVWVFSGAKDYMRKEQAETITSAKRFGVDVVETVEEKLDHAGIFKHAMSHQPILDWLVSEDDLRESEK